ncbi:TetR/AcrR family transcriptional regulator [Agromyces bauzanensis]|uniref:TetR family transcriptional regulator n=1 Tax=Agromyces bauzanensis TaxID=1308924 RepID=A0A917PHJ4_9MICO|nr:TetR/AcrR family transcriptional regulator [Agromyces bauzanensis]GGJ78204.1 TetR family transcriptional regulator [Agromyces bauzanensis]
MPTPERTSLDEIVGAGRDLLESGGLDGLTMQAVAHRVGVRAPSLYKRVRNRNELIALIAHATVRELGARVDAAAGDPDGDPRPALRRVARAARDFAHERPAGFRLVFTPGAEPRLDTDALEASIAPVLRLASGLAGEEHALDATRTFTAWLTGFVSMELAGAFRLGGDVERAFEFGLARLTSAFADGLRDRGLL